MVKRAVDYRRWLTGKVNCHDNHVDHPQTKLYYYCGDDWLKDEDPDGNKLGLSADSS